jgi:hypothetical protein
MEGYGLGWELSRILGPGRGTMAGKCIKLRTEEVLFNLY